MRADHAREERLLDPAAANASLPKEHASGRVRSDGDSPKPTPEDLFAHFQRRFNDLRDAGPDYLYATLDSWRLSFRTAMVRLVIALGCALAGAVALTTGIILLLLGVARAISWLFNAPEWVGSLTVGVLVVFVPLILGSVLMKRQKKVNLEKAKERYAARRERKVDAAA